ncbi:Putative phage-related protein [Pseudomonas [fluorescens] SBW25]|uniref:Phage-related protein n=1 Tax=Pseudomonas fluorescens (strain SBW25) TaxID=216595 RepID=C3KA66_PSEFS|nr:Putative phage-related protein [Pseudomonas fluorescens SBW25]
MCSFQYVVMRVITMHGVVSRGNGCCSILVPRLQLGLVFYLINHYFFLVWH